MLLAQGNKRQRKVKRQYRQYLIIMVLTSSQRAALRAKKALADGNTGFKPRGDKNKRAFEDLKRQSVSGTPNISASNDVSDESPLHKRIKITGAASSESCHHPKLENSSEPWTVRLLPKTDAELLLEKKEAKNREYHMRQMQISRLADKVKQLNIGLFSFLREIEDSQPTLALEDIGDDKKSEDEALASTDKGG